MDKDNKVTFNWKKKKTTLILMVNPDYHVYTWQFPICHEDSFLTLEDDMLHFLS